MSQTRVSTVLQEYDDAAPVARITIERPEKLNALDLALAEELTDKLRALAAAPDLRAVVLTGAGDRAFIGGADLNTLAGLDPAAARRFITAIHSVCAAVRACPCPVIGRINGYCIGAGMEIAAACDFRIVADSAVFSMPEVKVGLPSVVEAALLPTLIGWGKTRYLVLTGEAIDAHVADRWGFCEQVVPAAELDAAVTAALGAIVEAAPRAVRTQKALVGQWERLGLNDAIAAGIDAFEATFTHDEPHAYVEAFLERRREAKR